MHGKTTIGGLALLLAVGSYLSCGGENGQPDGGQLDSSALPDAAGTPDSAGTTPDAAAKPDSGAPDAGYPLPALPLHTQGRWILDATNRRFKLASVSWFGAESADFVVGGLDRNTLQNIASQIRTMGFNSVRLPWSNEMVESNPLVKSNLLAANPSLVGLHALDIFDRVIDALAREGLVVILDNHLSKAAWCCSDSDGNGLWYSSNYPETAWLNDWEILANRYRGTPAVVGVELRNEPRTEGAVSPTWGDGAPLSDWKAAAERGAEAVLKHNRNVLIVVQGLAYSTHFSDVATKPINLSVTGRLVYAPHNYSWFQSDNSYDGLSKMLNDNWGYILSGNPTYIAPIWVSEFGTCNTGPTCLSDTSGNGLWFSSFMRYLAETDADWAYWPLNGTQSTGRVFGDPETFGILNTNWNGASRYDLLMKLAAVQAATKKP